MNRVDVYQVGALVAAATWPFWWFRILVGLVHVDLPPGLLHDMAHTNHWLVTIPVGCGLGVLSKAARDAHLLKRGLDEWREWRRGEGPARPPTHPILASPPRGGGSGVGRTSDAPTELNLVEPSTGRSDVGSDRPLVPRSATRGDSLNRLAIDVRGRQWRECRRSNLPGSRSRLPTSPAGSLSGRPPGPLLPRRSA